MGTHCAECRGSVMEPRMTTDPVVNLYIYPDGRFGRSPALPDGAIKLATGRQSRIDALVIHTALRDQTAKCYRLPPQPPDRMAREELGIRHACGALSFCRLPSPAEAGAQEDASKAVPGSRPARQ